MTGAEALIESWREWATHYEKATADPYLHPDAVLAARARMDVYRSCAEALAAVEGVS